MTFLNPTPPGYSTATRDYSLGPNEDLWGASPIPGEDYRLLVGTEQSNGGFSLLRSVMNSGVARHLHDHEDESMYLLEGCMDVIVGDKTYRLNPDSFIFMPSKIPHEVRLVEGPCKVLSVASPGGIMDKLMAEIGQAIASGEVLDESRYQEIQLKHGVSAPDGWAGDLSAQ